MRTSRALAAPLACLVVLALAGCEAPLKPKSKQAESAPAASPAPSASPQPGTAPASADRRSATAPASRRPTLKVPKLHEPEARVGPVLGGDVSWPQCPKGMGIPQKQGQGSPMPVDAARYRDPRPDQRARVLPEPVPGQPGRLGARAAR